MRILLITTYYPPDTAIAAVRPAKFAKYLAQVGHQVTVLRSGDFYNQPDSAMKAAPESIQVLSYMGEQSAAEQYQRGVWVPKPQKAVQSSPAWGVSAAVNHRMSRLFHATGLFVGKVLLGALRRYHFQKKTLRKLKSQKFDVVFATYGNLENIFAGKYAAKRFHCKWVLDFRDFVTLGGLQETPVEHLISQAVQRHAVQSADACTCVSNGLAELLAQNGQRKPYVLYNGYDEAAADCVTDVPKQDGAFHLCYTGTLYHGLRDLSPLFGALRTLVDQGYVSTKDCIFDYAGSDFELLYHQAEPYAMDGILRNHGSIGRTQAASLQRGADLFLVATWNTDDSQGILTGKFYEGIHSRKPILALVSGTVPHSEIWLLNEQYHFGFCYEAASDATAFPLLCDYLKMQLSAKRRTTTVAYAPDPALFARFRYDRLTRELEALLAGLCNPCAKPQAHKPSRRNEA